MFSKLLEYWNYGTTYCGVEVVSDSEGFKFLSVTAKKIKGEFEDTIFNKSTSITEFAEVLPKNQHCFLTMNTNDVLIKAVDFNSDPQKALSSAFPGLSLSEFYYEVLQTKEKSFVSVCRKVHVDNLIHNIGLEKIDILGFRLGFNSLNKLIPSLTNGGDFIMTNRHSISLNAGEIKSFSEELQEDLIIRVDDVDINQSFLTAMSDLFHYVSEVKDITSNFEDVNIKYKSSQREKNFFRKGIVVGVGFLLLMLLTNMVFFNSYFREHQNLQEQTELASGQKERLVERQKNVESKEQLVNNILGSGNSKSSFYLNKIASGKPSSILLNKISYQPLERSIRPDKAIEYSEKTILIGGESNNKVQYSNWIDGLEKRSWVKTLTVLEYGNEGNKDSFEISIMLDDDTKK